MAAILNLRLNLIACQKSVSKKNVNKSFLKNFFLVKFYILLTSI